MALAAMASVTVALVGSQASGASMKVTPKVAVVAGGTNVYFAPWAPGAKAASKAFGITTTEIVAPTPTFELTVEEGTINSLVGKGYNAFVVMPDDPHGINTELAKLQARGIPSVVGAACAYDPTPAAMCLATDVYGSAYLETKTLIKAIGGSGNIAELQGESTDPNTILREKGVNKAVAESKGKVHLVQVVANIDTPTAAPPAVESLLAARGSTLNGLLSTDYNPSVAAATALTDNPQYRHIKFIGEDNDPVVMKAIQKGYIYGTMFQNSFGQAYIGAYVVSKLAEGCTINPKAPFGSTPQTKKFVNTGYFFIGKSNVNKYLGSESIPSQTKSIIKELNSKFLVCS